MGSFHVAYRSKGVPYLHQYPSYEQPLVFRSFLQEQLCMLHTARLLLGNLENPCRGTQYGKDQQLLHHLHLHLQRPLAYQC